MTNRNSSLEGLDPFRSLSRNPHSPPPTSKLHPHGSSSCPVPSRQKDLPGSTFENGSDLRSSPRTRFQACLPAIQRDSIARADESKATPTTALTNRCPGQQKHPVQSPAVATKHEDMHQDALNAKRRKTRESVNEVCQVTTLSSQLFQYRDCEGPRTPEKSHSQESPPAGVDANHLQRGEVNFLIPSSLPTPLSNPEVLTMTLYQHHDQFLDVVSASRAANEKRARNRLASKKFREKKELKAEQACYHCLVGKGICSQKLPTCGRCKK